MLLIISPADTKERLYILNIQCSRNLNEFNNAFNIFQC